MSGPGRHITASLASFKILHCRESSAGLIEILLVVWLLLFSIFFLQIAEQDVLSTWSGLRPLVKSDGGKEGGTQNLVRDHVVIIDEETGLVTITGGKWTTYRRYVIIQRQQLSLSAAWLLAAQTSAVSRPLRHRGVQAEVRIIQVSLLPVALGSLCCCACALLLVRVCLSRCSMAEETVDTALAVAKKYGHQVNPHRKKSVTEHIPITGAEGYHKAFFSQLAQSCVIVVKGPDGRARPIKLDPATAKHLAHSYGFRALHVVNIAKASSCLHQ